MQSLAKWYRGETNARTALMGDILHEKQPPWSKVSDQ